METFSLQKLADPKANHCVNTNRGERRGPKEVKTNIRLSDNWITQLPENEFRPPSALSLSRILL